MKKKWICLVLLGILTGCTPTAEQPPVVPEEQPNIEVNIEEQQNTTPAIQDEGAVLEAFETLVQDSVEPKELDAFLKKHMSNLGIEAANQALVYYLDALYAFAGHEDARLLDKSYQASLKEIADPVVTLQAIEALGNEALYETAARLYGNGLSIELESNIYVVTVDFENLLKTYGNEIGEDIKSYIELEAMILKTHTQDKTLDGLNHIAQLIVAHDTYLKDFPNSMVRAKVHARRDWLRRLYFGSDLNFSETADSDSRPLWQSFSDVNQFYPGTELEKMTQRYMSMWHVESTVTPGILDTFIQFYETGFEASQIALNEREISGGHVYPELTGLTKSSDINLSIEEEVRKLIQVYEAPEMKEWKILQSYEVAYLDEERYSVIITMNLVHPRFPRLSMRDIKAMTYDLESGQLLKLVDLLPTEEESVVHLLADVNAFAAPEGLGFKGLEENFENAYQTTEGIVIYTQRKDTGSDATELLIPNNEIETWIEE